MMASLWVATGGEIGTDPRAAKEIKKGFTCQYRNTVTLQHPDELVKPLARASGAPKRRLPSKMRRTAHPHDDSSCKCTAR